jgi:hypothetical protein
MKVVVGSAVCLILVGAIADANAQSVPPTSFGRPDLQGIWSFAALTPLERPDEFPSKAVLTDKEAAEYEQILLKRLDHDTPEGAESDCKGTGTHNEFWYDRGSVVKTRRSSLIVDPPDGKLPPLTAEGQKRRELRAARPRRADSWEDRGLVERCLIGFNAGPPMMPLAYNNNVQLFQTADTVVILTEMIHDARVVPLDGRAHLNPAVRQWLGSSRGRWEGDTLVVETRNFTSKTAFRGTGENLRLVERFTRRSADMLLYEFTVDDPSTFTRPWTAQIPMTRISGPLYEFACHEGNYGLANILAGARAEEAAAGRNRR